ncbi:hypothetical protein F5883DRAFT_580605 [Diaporthe sp. PMI_573]|nr:hypothetical protein F5883DRAFT_580605 [Diaporthaceae sp. PMI_573]
MEEVRKAKARRPHYKTRTGCVQCKKRKIKCDEQKPTCSKCKQHEVGCLYISKPSFSGTLTKSSSTSPPQNSVLNASLPASVLDSNQHKSFTMLDLELIHSWASTSGPITFLEKPSASSALHLTLVEIALQQPFLMHEILSLSALYLAQTKPYSATPYNLASTTHHDLALSLFQPALASLTRSNSDACFAFGLLLIIHTCVSQATSTHNFLLASQTLHDAEPVCIQWIKMHRGNKAVHAAVFPWLEDGVFAEFRPWKKLLEISTPKPLPPLEQQHLDSVAKTWSLSSHPDSVKQTLNKALEELRNTFSLTNTSENSMKHIAALAWYSLIPDEFVRLVEASVSEAMLILASYAVVLKRMDYIWWCRRTAEGLLAVAMNALGAEERWVEYLRWPIEKVLEQRQG